MSTAAIIVAGGIGERFGSAEGKQLAALAGRPVLAWTVDAFDACPEIDAIVLVAHPYRLEEYWAAARSSKVVAVAGGGETRQQSVANGLAALPEGADLVAVHDGARPLVLPDTIAAAIAALRGDDDVAGAVVGHPVTDTVKRVGEGERIESTVDRSDLWVVQTPQVFRVPVLREAYASASAEGYCGTDDAQLVERLGGRVMMVRGPRDNIKVTVPEDLVVAGAVLEARRKGLL